MCLYLTLLASEKLKFFMSYKTVRLLREEGISEAYVITLSVLKCWWSVRQFFNM